MGRLLVALGAMLFIGGIGFCVGLVFGLFTSFPHGGVIAMFLGNAIGWIGHSLAAGKLKSDIKANLKREATDTLRLRTSLSPLSAVFVILGFAIVVVAVVVLWWIVSRSATEPEIDRLSTGRQAKHATISPGAACSWQVLSVNPASTKNTAENSLVVIQPTLAVSVQL